MAGSRPTDIDVTVITLGRMRLTALVRMASRIGDVTGRIAPFEIDVQVSG